MKKFLIFLAAGLSLLPSTSPGAQTAQARFFCLSLRVHRAAANDTIGTRWTMDMTTLVTGINEELAPGFFVGGYSNSAYVDLYSELLDDTFAGGIFLDIPDFADANGNGFADFFESSQAVTALPGQGAYNISDFGSGTFNATWFRDAGSVLGSCSYTIPNFFGGTLTFFHPFELIEYAGELTYTPGSNTVAGSVSLTNTNSMATLEGPVQFAKSATNRFNELTLQSVLWTNTSQQTFDLYTTTTFLRRTTHSTNYYGNVEFNDGDLNTPGSGNEDYYSWQLSIDDLNDADHDGIPDFSDDLGGVAPPRRPQLLLTKGQTNLLLRISGEIGRLHHVLETTQLVTGNWVTNFSLTLTNDPQTVSLPLSPSGSKFWRALAQ